ncbi:hypothetical protein Dimus_028797, partial [Dionaea muscipula]
EFGGNKKGKNRSRNVVKSFEVNEGVAQNHGTLLADVFSYVPSRRPPRVDPVATSTKLSRTDSSPALLDEEAELKRELTCA